MTTPSAPPGRPGYVRHEWLGVIGLSLLIVLAINLPYALAYAPSSSHVFSGILFNPADGQSYFAKLREGLRGEWLFTLPYTTEPGTGVLIFTYYLLLGNLARLLNLSLDLAYHTARLAGSWFYLLTAYHFIAHFRPGPGERLVTWLAFIFTSGLGWLALFAGGFTSDLWVAEAIPFLSVFSNMHFTVTAALMLWVFLWTLPGLRLEPVPARHLALAAIATSLMAQTQPLGLITTGLVLGGLTLERMWARRRLLRADVLPLVVFAAAALPWLLYGFWVTNTHPVLKGWNAQNLTASPPVWDYLISGGVPLLLALPGGLHAARRRGPGDRILLAWLGLTALALYAPFNLQRRLTLGIWMPLILLAAQGFEVVFRPRLQAAAGPKALVWRAALVLGLAASVLSNVFVYMATLDAVRHHKPDVFFTRDEAAALTWLQQNARPTDTVLAAPATGLFIPARTDARVIYGHPFETLNAPARRQAVEFFFEGLLAPDLVLGAYPADFIFYDPREAELGPLPPLDAAWREVFRQGQVAIYGR